jgi:hypothetical protein
MLLGPACDIPRELDTLDAMIDSAQRMERLKPARTVKTDREVIYIAALRKRMDGKLNKQLVTCRFEC